jgi:hypothetical protein
MSEPGPEHKIRVSRINDFLTSMPGLFGFTPERSLALCAFSAEGRMVIGFRYDLPDEAGIMDVCHHAMATLEDADAFTVIGVGYGTEDEVWPTMHALMRNLDASVVGVSDLLRVEGDHYWSYVRGDDYPDQGKILNPDNEVAASLGELGFTGSGSRADLVASIAFTPTEAMADAIEEAMEAAVEIYHEDVEAALGRWRGIMERAVELYRGGGTLSDPRALADLALAVSDIRVRDLAWAMMDLAWKQEHRRLWTDLLRNVDALLAPAPGCLLAIVAMQLGDGPLVNVALDRATELPANEDYSLAQILRQGVAMGMKPEDAVPPPLSVALSNFHA